MKKTIFSFLFLASFFSCFSQNAVHVGDILCTDNSTVSKDDFAESGKTAMGIVFFVDNSLLHGWAVSLTEVIPVGQYPITWGDTMYLYTSNCFPTVNYAINDTAGYQNYLDIQAFADTLAFQPLSRICNAENCAINYGQGWFLPALGQLNILYGNIPEVQATIAFLQSHQQMTTTHYVEGIMFPYYWSSTTKTMYEAWALGYNGMCFALPKYATERIRPVRNF